jgi:flagellar protein FliO/FliZ
MAGITPQGASRLDDYAVAVRFRRPAARLGTALLVLAVGAACLASGAAAAAAPAFHRDETPLPKQLSEQTTKAAATTSSSGGSLARTIVGLLIVLAVLFGVYWLLKTFARGKGIKGDGRLEIVATTALAGNRAVHLIRVGDNLVLVGSAEGSITRLRSYSSAESAALEARIDIASGELRELAPGQAKAGGVIDELRRRTTRR